MQAPHLKLGGLATNINGLFHNHREVTGLAEAGLSNLCGMSCVRSYYRVPPVAFVPFGRRTATVRLRRPSCCRELDGAAEQQYP